MNPVIIFAVISSVFVESQLVASMPTGDPILIVPGILGSQLSVNHRCSEPAFFDFCDTSCSSVPLWISLPRFLNFWCFKSELMLKHNRTTDQYSSTSDLITVEVPGFGETNTVEKMGGNVITSLFLDHFSLNLYFREFVDYFVERGYERGKSIRAAPYDWRVGPEELQRRGYYKDVKGLIEKMYCENHNRKVTIVAHSLGAAIMLHFLTQNGVVTQAWKDQYIGNFITLSGAWSGGNSVLQFEISGLIGVNREPGDMFNHFCFLHDYFTDPPIPILHSIFYLQDLFTDPLTPILRSFQSIYFLLPRPSIWNNTVLVSTPTQTYTASDYQQLFSDIGLTDGFAMYQGIENINRDFPSPNVPTHCFYGVGVKTPLSFRYTRSFPEGAEDNPEVTMGDGDGAVNLQSSQVCLRWANNNGGHFFRSMAFNGTHHLKIVRIEAVLKEIGTVVGAESWWDKIKILILLVIALIFIHCICCIIFA